MPEEVQLTRKPFLINRALNKFLKASVLSAVAIQMAIMIDAVIVANFVGPDAMSAINVCAPVIAIMYNLGYLVSMGGTLLVSKAIGENDSERGNHITTVALAMLIALGIVLAAAGYLLSDWMVSLLCSSSDIGSYAKTYLLLFFIIDLLPVFMLNALCGFTEAEGSPSMVTRALFIGGVENVVLDLLFVGVFHWGIEGAMYATAINDLTVDVILCVYLLRNSKVQLKMPHIGVGRIVNEIISEGTPLTVGEMTLMGGLMVINSVIIYTLGDYGMFCWSICMEILSLVLIGMSGVETSMISIGGYLVGDDDINGFRMLVNHALQVVCTILLLLMLVILIVPDLVAMLFGARDAGNIDTLSHALRLFSLSLIPLGIMNLMRVVYQLMGHRFASGFMFTCQTLLMDAIIGVAAFLVPEHVWWAFPCSGILMVGIQLIYTNVQHLRNANISRFTLIPKADEERSLDFSVNYRMADLKEALQRIYAFVNSHPSSRHRANDVTHTCEEIMKNIIEYAEGSIVKRDFDFHMHRTEHKITIVIKDAGKAFNPMAYLPQKDADPDYEHLGILLMYGNCDQLSYNYMWRQNIMTGIFFLQDVEPSGKVE